MTEPVDPMDQRLRAYADRWRDAAPSSPQLDTDRLIPGWGGRRTWSLALVRATAVAAVIVLAIAAGAVLVLHRPGESGPGIAQHPSTTPPTTPSTSSPPQPIQEPPRTRDEALRRQLADNTFVRLQLLGIGPGGFAAPTGRVLCALHVMGSSEGGSTLYLWLSCADYTVADGNVAEVSGGGDPAVVEVRGRGTAVELKSITFPRQEYRDADIKRLFPTSIASNIYDEANTHGSPSAAQLKEEVLTLAGQPGASPTSTDTPSSPMDTVPTCSSWLSGGSVQLSAITTRYGDPHDCFALSGVWVMTTDSPTGAGFIGIHVCDGSCSHDVPTKISDWRFYQPTTKPGAYERVAGTNPDGSILFVGDAGEITFDPRTRTFSPQSAH